jgi:hypothetical protein
VALASFASARLIELSIRRIKELQPCRITDAVVLMYTWIFADFELLRQTSAAQLGFSLNQIRALSLGIPSAPSFY